ncbi:MAG: carbohydrate kinase family protein [Verrucomicrobiota bacterium JB022]|nr:carbohydrate kinase family protein [Verrucomicrobiota bacterium JB022]
MPEGIIAAGNWILDQVKLLDVWPEQDALATIRSQTAGNGGSPYNLLKDLALLGARFPLRAVGLVGDDAYGRDIIADCRNHGIDTAQLATTPAAPTSYTDVMTVASTGRRTFFHHRGANALLGPEHFNLEGQAARWFHLGYLLLLDRLDAIGPDGRPVAAAVLERARSAGLKVSLDCVSEAGPRLRQVVSPVLPLVDLLFINDFECEGLTGISLRQGEALCTSSVEKAARQLVAQGVREWVVVHFPEGACACSAQGEVCWQGSVCLPQEFIAGAAGAGDAFAAGVLYCLHDERPMAAALELGVAAAAASLRDVTCSAGVQKAEDCIALAADYGCRSLMAFAPSRA